MKKCIRRQWRNPFEAEAAENKIGMDGKLDANEFQWGEEKNLSEGAGRSRHFCQTLSSEACSTPIYMKRRAKLKDATGWMYERKRLPGTNRIRRFVAVLSLLCSTHSAVPGAQCEFMEVTALKFRCDD